MLYKFPTDLIDPYHDLYFTNRIQQPIPKLRIQKKEITLYKQDPSELVVESNDQDTPK